MFRLKNTNNFVPEFLARKFVPASAFLGLFFVFDFCKRAEKNKE
jgi:hypothetical protein